MKENQYDDENFFEQYSQMNRSIEGLKGAGEWHELKKMLPEFKGKKVLDLGCGFGWHCKYAVEEGANLVIGIDVSEKMLQKARQINSSDKIIYQQKAIEDYEYAENTFDVIISSLAFHYVEDFNEICKKMYQSLKENGKLIFSIEHPIFTAQGKEEWIYNEKGEIQHWPVDYYFKEGIRKTKFLGEEVTKYHRTLTSYVNTLLETGFNIEKVIEPKLSSEMLAQIPQMEEELRRPMMLLIAVTK